MSREDASWALVTGSSSGIGRALALELARRGFSLVVCGRDAERVEEVRRLCGEEALGLVGDLAEATGVDAVIRRLDEEDIHLGVFVSNAGATIHGPFVTTEIERELELVRTQIDATLRLTKYVAADMAARGEGRILVVGSVYGHSAAPFQAVYAACKTFLTGFARSLRAELAASGVSVTLASPGLTESRLRSRSGPPDRRSRLMRDADVVARAACDGLLAGRASVVTGWENKLFLLAARLLPTRWVVGLVNRVNSKRRLGAPS